MEASQIGKWLISIGLSIVVIGGLFLLASKMGIHFGKLSGDIAVHKEKFSMHVPIATSIIVSILLTIVLNLLIWLMRK